MSHIKLPVVITPSRVDGGLRCHRKHVLSDILGRAQYWSPSLEFGSVIHAGVNSHWLGTKFPGQEPWEKVIAKEWHERFVLKPDISQKNVSVDMANAMMDHYTKNATLAGPFTERGGYKLVDCEQRFEVPIPLDGDNRAIVSFQCDRIVFNEEENHLVIVDTKTASRLDARWEKQWDLSIQMKLYKLMAMEVFGVEKTDVVIEGVLKHVPSEIRYYTCPDWSKLQLAEALFQARTIAIKDENILVKGMAYNVMDPSERTPVLNSKEAIEEIAVKYTMPNYGECFAFNIECPFRQICVADVPERVGLLRSEYFELPESEENY